MLFFAHFFQKKKKNRFISSITICLYSAYSSIILIKSSKKTLIKKNIGRTINQPQLTTSQLKFLPLIYSSPLYILPPYKFTSRFTNIKITKYYIWYHILQTKLCNSECKLNCKQYKFGFYSIFTYICIEERDYRDSIYR